MSDIADFVVYRGKEIPACSLAEDDWRGVRNVIQ